VWPAADYLAAGCLPSDNIQPQSTVLFISGRCYQLVIPTLPLYPQNIENKEAKKAFPRKRNYILDKPEEKA
jgi:hypothetical protein